MAKIALIGDTHCGARSDDRRFSEYFAKFYSEVYFPYLKEHGIKHQIHLGDVFDRRKFVNYMTLRETKDFFIQPMIDLGLECHFLVGNHDTPLKTTNEVNNMDLMFGHTDFNIVSEPTTITIDGAEILLVPWIVPKEKETAFKAIEESNAQICCGHFELSGFYMMRGVKSDHGMSPKILEKFPWVFSGHYHHKQYSSGVHYLGCPYEITRADFNDPKGFHVFDTETGTLEFIENPFRIFRNVYYNEDNLENLETDFKDMFVRVYIEKRTNVTKFEKFLDAIQNSDPHEFQIIDNTGAVEFDDDSGVNISEFVETTTLLKNYAMSHDEEGIDNSRLSDLLLQLHSEAMCSEIE